MRPITQLTENEYYELQDSYYYELLENGMMINHPSDITNDMMADHGEYEPVFRDGKLDIG
jgi:hypothetical protein